MANGVWVVLQHREGQFPRISWEAVAAAQKLAAQLGTRAEAVVLGAGVGPAGAEVAKLRCGGDRIRDAGLELFAVVLGNNEDSHHMILASLI